MSFVLQIVLEVTFNVIVSHLHSPIDYLECMEVDSMQMDSKTQLQTWYIHLFVASCNCTVTASATGSCRNMETRAAIFLFPKFCYGFPFIKEVGVVATVCASTTLQVFVIPIDN